MDSFPLNTRRCKYPTHFFGVGNEPMHHMIVMYNTQNCNENWHPIFTVWLYNVRGNNLQKVTASTCRVLL